MEAVATVSALRQGVVPPTLHYEIPDAALDLDYVPDGPRALGSPGLQRVAISNSFGFGGHNVVLVFTDAPASAAPSATGPVMAGAAVAAPARAAEQTPPVPREGAFIPGVYPL